MPLSAPWAARATRGQMGPNFPLPTPAWPASLPDETEPLPEEIRARPEEWLAAFRCAISEVSRQQRRRVPAGVHSLAGEKRVLVALLELATRAAPPVHAEATIDRLCSAYPRLTRWVEK